ncbi:hypothetical protein GOODEAATRI_034096, partial [Goodea atripinnis]
VTPGCGFFSLTVLVIGRGAEIDVLAEDMHVAILVHQREGNKFLWPLLRKRLSAGGIDGIIALNPAIYEVVPQPTITVLRIQGTTDIPLHR